MTADTKRAPLDPIEDALVRLIRSAELARRRTLEAGKTGKEKAA